MSNRLRILFYDGNRNHFGKHALAAMQNLVGDDEGTPDGIWVMHDAWVRKGRPQYRDKKTLVRRIPDGSVIVGSRYLIPRPPRSPEPEAKNVVERCRELWARLPDSLKMISQLVVVRENRKNSWKHSTVNPARYGHAKGSWKGTVEADPGDAIDEAVFKKATKYRQYTNKVKWNTPGELVPGAAGSPVGSGKKPYPMKAQEEKPKPKVGIWS